MWRVVHHRRGYNSLLLATLTAVLWLFFNASVNRHIHILSDGYVISHAHPFKKSPSDSESPNSHNHSQTELMLLSLISSIATTLLILLIVRPYLNGLQQQITITNSHREPVRKYFQVHHYHAPPSH